MNAINSNKQSFKKKIEDVDKKLPDSSKCTETEKVNN